MLDAKAQAALLPLTISMDTCKGEATVLVNSHVTWNPYSHPSGCNRIISSCTGLWQVTKANFRQNYRELVCQKMCVCVWCFFLLWTPARQCLLPQDFL